MFEPITLQIIISGGSPRETIINKEYIYGDLDDMEMQNYDMGYKITEIAREEIEIIKKRKFLEDNPEYYSQVDIDDLKASQPL